MPDSEVLPRRQLKLQTASVALLLALLGCQTVGAPRWARASGADASPGDGTPRGENAGIDGGSSRAPAPPGATAKTAPAAKSLALTPSLHACLSARPDLTRAHVSLTVRRGSPETRLVLQMMLKEKAAALGVDVAFGDERCESRALICVWTASGKAAELATSWAGSLIDPTAGELYAIRGEVLRSAQAWDDASFWWRVHTASSALGRGAASSLDPLVVANTRGANYLRSVAVDQLEASLRRALIGAELSVFDPVASEDLANSLRDLATRAQPVSHPAPETGTQSSKAPSLVTLKEKDSPEPAVAVLAWGSDDDDAASFAMRLGLEVLRTRFNLAHAKKTEVRASWTPQTPFSAPPRFALLGPVASMPNALNLLRQELRRLTSATGVPTQTELDRALLRVRSQEQGSAPRSLCRQDQPGGPAEVTRALRVLPAPHVVLAAGEETPPTEAE